MSKAGDIVLIKMHPSSGNELKKFRPAVILKEQKDRGFITFVPFTTNTKIYSPSTELLVKPTEFNGLDKSSLILCWYIQTVGTQRIQKNIGRLTKGELNRTLQAVKKSLS